MKRIALHQKLTIIKATRCLAKKLVKKRMNQLVFSTITLLLLGCLGWTIYPEVHAWSPQKISISANSWLVLPVLFLMVGGALLLSRFKPSRKQQPMNTSLLQPSNGQAIAQANHQRITELRSLLGDTTQPNKPGSINQDKKRTATLSFPSLDSELTPS